jgi:hypothetical protein
VEHSAELLRCLRDGDVTAIRRLYREIAPHLPQPSSDVEAWASLHHARTQVEALPLKLRAYSHRWLLDQGLPSGLPDALKPLAERMYPRIVTGVGISVNSTSAVGRLAVPIIQRAMQDAVLEAYAEGKTTPRFVRARMNEARQKALRSIGAVRGF